MFGQIAGLTWMCAARGPTGVLRGAAAVMAANAATFLCAAMLASAFGGSMVRTVGSFVFATGCLIGAAEGAPKTVAALKSLLS